MNTFTALFSKKLLAILIGFTLVAGLSSLWLQRPTTLANPADMLVPQDIVGDSVNNTETLSDLEKSDLIFIREEEKLARDVYIALYQKWNMPIFQNIAKSEETHMTTMGVLLDKYNIQDPVTTVTPGVFQNQELQNLYVSLVQQGESSLEQALMVGATIEDLDIKDIQEALENTEKADIQNAYQNLARGSRNHLRAFNRQFEEKTNTSYQAQYISHEELTEILNSPQENGKNRNR